MTLFKYGLICHACGRLTCKYTSESLAKKGAESHSDACRRVMNESDHMVIVVSLEKKGECNDKEI